MVRPTVIIFAPVSRSTAISPVCLLMTFAFGSTATNTTAVEVSILKDDIPTP
jgi:hypothetical protein